VTYSVKLWESAAWQLVKIAPGCAASVGLAIVDVFIANMRDRLLGSLASSRDRALQLLEEVQQDRNAVGRLCPCRFICIQY
jgi:hypothetical protein